MPVENESRFANEIRRETIMAIFSRKKITSDDEVEKRLHEVDITCAQCGKVRNGWVQPLEQLEQLPEHPPPFL